MTRYGRGLLIPATNSWTVKSEVEHTATGVDRLETCGPNLSLNNGKVHGMADRLTPSGLARVENIGL